LERRAVVTGSVRNPIPTENRILAALPREEYERLLPNLERVNLKYDQILYEAGEAIRYAYFLDSAVVSMLSVTEEGSTLEVGLVGNEGILGVPIFLRAREMPYRAIVQASGTARRMKSEVLREEFDQCGPLHDLLLRYLHVLVIQLSQAGVCNRFHNVEQRLCRWLLMAHDRAKSGDLRFTQEFLSQMLGVQRDGISMAAGTLQKAGLIRYSRGHITILDRKGLEAATCECYRIVKEEFDRFFGD
jgi:CRP-like cAMP-binding protein